MGRADGDAVSAGFGAILVGTDGSATATVAVRRAVELAAALGARLQIVSAYAATGEGGAVAQPAGSAAPARPDEGAGDVALWALNPPREDVLALLAEAAAAARAAGVSEVETFARVGDAADAILDVAEEQGCDVIVVGSKGTTGATRFLLGSVPHKVSHHAPCSVLIVRTG
jgi:nucleotide-binding universal stress UspA family protein